jgi:hypothetical protein
MKHACLPTPHAQSTHKSVCWLLLQLQDEKAIPFDPATFSRPESGGMLDPKNASKVETAMKAFCSLHDEANVDAVPDVLSEDFYEVRKPRVLAKVFASHVLGRCFESAASESRIADCSSLCICRSGALPMKSRKVAARRWLTTSRSTARYCFS